MSESSSPDPHRRRALAALDGRMADGELRDWLDALDRDPAAVEGYVECVELCDQLESAPEQHRATRRSRGPRRFVAPAIAATLLAAAIPAAYLIGRGRPADPSPRMVAGDGDTPQLTGHAILRRASSVDWGDASPMTVGDWVSTGPLRWASGTVELQMLCGATLTVEGPADLNIESDARVRCRLGRLRADVPQPARGFTVVTDRSRVVDLGTSFAMDVGPEGDGVRCLDGEIEWHAGDAPMRLVTGGQQAATEHYRGEVTDPGSSDAAAGGPPVAVVSATRRWSGDPDVIAWYPCDATHGAVSSVAMPVSVGGVEPGRGRFDAPESARQFHRPGARMRVRLPGDYPALTIAGWFRIDALPQRYNALFMADGYENGEPHWQMRDDGRLMFSVMIDETAEVYAYSPPEKQVLRDAGRHFVYMSDGPVWDVSRGGRWMHLAASFDPAGRVRQYVDGRMVCDHAVGPDWVPETFRIGGAEIGNWGQPFRRTPSFAVRHLAGAVDEIGLWARVIGPEEIAEMYERTKPQ